MKKKHYILVFILAVALAGVAVGSYLVSSGSAPKSDEEIRELFFCDRITLDVRATDVYCENPDLYREHEKNNSVIDPNDFNRLQ